MNRSLLLFLLLPLIAFPVAEAASPPAPVLKAPAYILIDATTDTVLAEHNPDQHFDPASLTKIMTSYVAFQALHKGLIKMNDLVTISRKARRAIGSRMFVELGSQVSVEDLLRGIIVQSGNDASIALAEHIAGNEETFVRMMNAEAERLQLTQTLFQDTAGLAGSKHYMSARDIAHLSAHLIRDFPELYKMFKEREFTWNRIRQPNRNQLLWKQDTVDGLKTGFTQTAQYCLAASALRPDLDNMRLIAVVLGASSSRARTRETWALLQWGFRFFRTRPAIRQDRPLTHAQVWFAEQRTVPVGATESPILTLPVGQYKKLKTIITLNEPLDAPLTKDQEVGTITLRHEDRVLGEVPAIALEDVPAGSWSTRMKHYFLRLLE